MQADRNKDHETHVFKVLKAFYGPVIDTIWKRYQGMTPDRKARQLRRLTTLAVNIADMRVGGEEKILLEPPPARIISGGPYHLGSVVYHNKTPIDFTLYPEELLQHTFVLGPTGTGKTTLLTGIITELLRTGIPWWAIDWKRDTRSLLNHPHGNILVLTVGNNLAPLRLNILHPPRGVTREEWVEKLSDVVSEGYLLGPGARRMLKKGLLTAINAHGEHTTFRDAAPYIRTEILGAKARELQWLQSCERAIDELTTGPYGDALNSRSSMSLETLLAENVVFELEGLGIDQGRTFSIFLLQALLLIRKKQHLPREVLRHVLIFDEAQNIFLKEKQGDPPSVQSQLMREIRAYGEGVIALTQQLENFSNSVKANSYTTIVLPTTDTWDVRVMSETLDVKPEWIKSIPRGHAIVRLRYRYQKSFLISFPEQPLKNTITTDATIRERYEAWNGSRPPAAAVITEAPPVLGERDITLLLDIASHPISTVTQRYERLGWNPRLGNGVQQTILGSGSAEFLTVDTGTGPIGKLKVLTLTTKGEAIVLANGGTIKSTGAAGIIHELWKSRLRDRCEQHGYTVTEEYHLGSRKRADLRATKRDRTIIIEVETGNSDISANITKNNGQELIMFCTSESAYRAARRVIPADITILTPATINNIHNILRR